MHRHRPDALLAEPLDEAVGAALGANEDQGAAALGVIELADQGVDLVGMIEVDEAVLDVGLALRLRRVDVAAGVAGVGARDLAGRAVERRREEQRLAVGGGLGHDPVDGGLEAHVEHPVGLVEHQQLHVLQGQGPALRAGPRAGPGSRPRCGPGGLACLRLDADAAVDGGHRERPGVCDLVELVDDLAGQLARRREDERRGAARLGRDEVDQRHAEGQGLARSGRGLGENVAAGEDVLDDEPLHGERLARCRAPAGRRRRVWTRRDRRMTAWTWTATPSMRGGDPTAPDA